MPRLEILFVVINTFIFFFVFLQFHCKTYATTTTTAKVKTKIKIDFQFSFTTKTTKKTIQLSAPFNETPTLVGYSVCPLGSGAEFMRETFL